MRSTEFKMLVVPYTARLFRMAFSLMKNKEEAEDLVQEVYLKLWKMRSELKEYNSIEALAVRMTRNLCLDHLRRRTVSQQAFQVEQQKVVSLPDTPSEVMERSEREQMVRTVIDELPEPQRTLVHLRHLEDKEYEEIAEIMEMNVNTIRVSLSRARKQMKEIIVKRRQHGE